MFYPLHCISLSSRDFMSEATASLKSLLQKIVFGFLAACLVCCDLYKIRFVSLLQAQGLIKFLWFWVGWESLGCSQLRWLRPGKNVFIFLFFLSHRLQRVDTSQSIWLPASRSRLMSCHPGRWLLCRTGCKCVCYVRWEQTVVLWLLCLVVSSWVFCLFLAVW